MLSGQKYEFGDWLLDPDEHLLLRDRKPVPLGPKVFETLLVLVENAGHLVPKDEFMKRVWPDTFVEDAALTQNISHLRRVLSKADGAVIETVPKRGYRLLLPVRVVAERLPVAGDRAAGNRHQPSVTQEVLREDGASTNGVCGNPQIPIATSSAQPVALQRLFATRNALVMGLTLCAVGLFFLYSRHSLRSKAGQPVVIPAVTNVGDKYTPSLSPDAQHLAFAWNGGAGRQSNLYVKLVGTEESLRLTKQASIDFNPIWSPDGRYIAFCRIQNGETGIYIIPALGGTERRVRETLWEELEFREVLRSAGRLSWSPDGKLLAFSDRAFRNEAPSIFLLSLDSLEVRRLTLPSRGDFNPAFSPDGKTLAFTRASQGFESIYTVPVSGGEEKRLISDGTDHWGLAWTPDGRDIIFADAGWPLAPGWLWKISASGGEPERLQFGQEGVEPSIRGNRLVYVRQTANLNTWRRKLNSSPASPSDRLISSTRMESGPQFSPDGSRITFESTRSGSYEVWMCRSDGSGPVQLTHFNSVTGTPRWSPDGQQIAFDSDTGGNMDIYVIDSQGGAPRRLTSEPSIEAVPSWSRDGRWIYFASDRTGSSQVWKMPSTGGPALQVTHQGGFAAFESPDGRFLFYAKGLRVPGLWRIPTNGGEEIEVINSLEAGYWGYWAVVENGIYYLDSAAKPGISFFDIATHRITRVFDLENSPARFAPGLAISPDKETILYTQLDALNSDIILVENFR